MNTYLIRDTEIIDSTLETNESTLSQTEIDQLLALSTKHKSDQPLALHFATNSNNCTLLKTNLASEEKLFGFKVSKSQLQKWPATLSRNILFRWIRNRYLHSFFKF